MHSDTRSALYPRGHAPQLLQLPFDNNSRPQYNPGHRVGLFTGPANKVCYFFFIFCFDVCSITFFPFLSKCRRQNLPNI